MTFPFFIVVGKFSNAMKMRDLLHNDRKRVSFILLIANAPLRLLLIHTHSSHLGTADFVFYLFAISQQTAQYTGERMRHVVIHTSSADKSKRRNSCNPFE